MKTAVYLTIIYITCRAVLGDEATGRQESDRDNFNLVNSYRSSQGLSTLTWDENLASEAYKHSERMYKTGDFSHSTFPGWENIASSSGQYTWDTVANGFFDQWEASPRHNSNMLLATHTCGGVGIVGDGSKFYGTQIFLDSCE